MGLNRAQRRRQNRLNAKHSSGPTSQEGKRVASLNGLRSGLTARTLVLPNENAEEVQARVDAWYESCQPQGHDEEELVDQIALAAQRIQRIAKAENAILAEQVANAEVDWKHANESRLLDLTGSRFRSEPARVRLELLSFGLGVEWLLERWLGLLQAFGQYGCWNNPALIQLALRLDGIHPEYLYSEPVRGYELAVLAASCLPNQDDPELTSMLQHIPPEWLGQHGVKKSVERAEAQQRIVSHIESRVVELRKLAEQFRERDEHSLAMSKERAHALRDTPQNRLLVRYMKSAETSFDKAYRTLQKLQSERQNVAESASKPAAEEGPKAGLPNEAEIVARARSKRLRVGTCVKIKEWKYELVHTTDGNILLSPWVDEVAEPVSEVVPTPETVV